MIRVKNATVRFQVSTILSNVELNVAAEESFAIIGPSGSGKSVLLKCIAGLILCAEGSVEVNSRNLSMLFQKNALFDSLTLVGNLLLPMKETLGMVGEEALDKAMGLLAAVGLEESANLLPDEISGGMQKRLGIARALSIDPEVILYDEPTAGLDPVTSKSIAELILKLQEENRTTIVMVTNDLQRAYQIADRIGFCHEGKFQVVGTPEEVLNTHQPDLRNFIYGKRMAS